MVLVGVGHFGFVLFAKTSKPIWPIPVTPSDFAFFPLRSKKARSELQKNFYTGNLHSSEIQKLSILTPSPLCAEVSFYYRLPEKPTQNKDPAKPNVLLLIPSFNGDGQKYLCQQDWTRFADQQRLLLVSPSFETNLEEISSGFGYYYPKLWSGDATLAALNRIASLTGLRVDKILMFGFSAGAHFTHRFALWKPDKVKAFVACSAGWWDEPTTALRDVPALILCGEDDERYGATLNFLQQGLSLHLPWIWRSYKGVNHSLTQGEVKIAQAFLTHYASNEKSENYVGDIRSFSYYHEQSPEANRVPIEYQVILPSKKVAEAWKQE